MSESKEGETWEVWIERGDMPAPNGQGRVRKWEPFIRGVRSEIMAHALAQKRCRNRVFKVVGPIYANKDTPKESAKPGVNVESGPPVVGVPALTVHSNEPPAPKGIGLGPFVVDNPPVLTVHPGPGKKEEKKDETD